MAFEIAFETAERVLVPSGGGLRASWEGEEGPGETRHRKLRKILAIISKKISRNS